MLPLTFSVLRVLPDDRLRESGYRPEYQGENPLPFHVLSSSWREWTINE
jgi:hypothetical protein